MIIKYIVLRLNSSELSTQYKGFYKTYIFKYKLISNKTILFNKIELIQFSICYYHHQKINI